MKEICPVCLRAECICDDSDEPTHIAHALQNEEDFYEDEEDNLCIECGEPLLHGEYMTCIRCQYEQEY